MIFLQITQQAQKSENAKFMRLVTGIALIFLLRGKRHLSKKTLHGN